MKNIYLCQFFFCCIFFTLISIPFANAQLVSQPYEILLKTERVVLPENILDFNFSENISNEEVIENAVYRLIQFYEIPDVALHQRIKNTGIELLDYIPNNTYVSSIPTNLTREELEQLNIRSIVKIKKKWKQSNPVRNQVFDEWAMKKNSLHLSVRYFQNINIALVEKELNKIGVRITKSPDFIHLVQVQTTPSKINQIVDLPFVSYVDQITDPGTPEDDLGRSLHRTNMVASDFPSGRHYTGEGVSILVRDDGDIGPHIDFHGRLNQFGNDGGTHGDGVAGVASGAGNMNPKFRGAATGSTVFVRNYVADFLDGTLDLHQNEGVLLTNSSYGNGCNGGYTIITETVDLQVFENPTLCHIFSGGNSNNQDCDYGAGDQWGNITGGHKQGKNVIATANIFSDGALVNSSSHGPAHDGRIKPDIAANGQNQMSTEPGNLYEPFGGTSGAAPCVMGTMAQLYQAYRELNGGDTPESALIKATILNTANDLGNEGPDFKFGWGHLNAFRAVKLLEDERYFDGTVDQGEMIQHNIDIPDGTKQVRFMLYWMDEAANPMSSPALVNDLDLSVIDPNSNNLLPWVLDPTPDPATLDLPAGNGLDNLNNMEQVLINNPTAGDYVLSINGSIIPNGAVKYYIVYEVIGTDDITVTFPNGGEGLVPNEMERIHWDALGEDEDFTLEYSTDNGATWNPIALVGGAERIYDWTVPEYQTGQVQIRISRGTVFDVSDASFSIGNVPSNVEVIQACPDYVRITWDLVDGALGYDIFSLGDKYMDSIGTTSELYFDIPIANPFDENWFAVRAIGNNDFTGRRTIAINHSAGISACNINHDVANTIMLSPVSGTTITCDNLEQLVSMRIQNNSLFVADSMNFYYQINNEPPVMEPYNFPISSFEEIEYTFSTPITVAASGDYTVTTWVEYSLDEAAFNNQNEITYSVIVEPDPIVPDISEDFESGIFPPDNWMVFNNDGFITWSEISVVGIDNNPSTVTWMNNYDYNSGFEEDEFVSFPIDLTDAGAPLFSFDMAYAPYSQALSDSLRVEIYTDCGSQYHSTLYGAFGLDLATVPDYEDNGAWFPENSGHWRNESFDLNEFVGERILIKFICVNNYGNNLFLDNINILDANQPPTASLTASDTAICVDAEVEFNNTSTGVGNTYDWGFGVDASIGAVSGDGPFTVSYSTPGTKTITLVATNPNGTNTITQQIEVVPPPVPSYTYTVENGEVTFTNTSINSNDYLWDFGDGNLSTDENPVYTFGASDVYTVVLVAQSDVCDDVQFAEEINVIVTGIEDNDLDFDAIVLPNPNQGKFNIQISDFANRDFEVTLVDLTGRIIEKNNIQSTDGNTILKIENNTLTAGVYFVKISNEAAVKTLKVIVQ